VRREPDAAPDARPEPTSTGCYRHAEAWGPVAAHPALRRWTEPRTHWRPEPTAQRVPARPEPGDPASAHC
jgi:hypothetical protein